MREITGASDTSVYERLGRVSAFIVGRQEMDICIIIGHLSVPQQTLFPVTYSRHPHILKWLACPPAHTLGPTQRPPPAFC